MARHKGVSRIKRPVGPIDHPVSAIFDPPYISPSLAVVRWWYGDRFDEQRTATPAPDFVARCKERVQQADLTTMELKVWGTAQLPPVYDFAVLLGGRSPRS